jgi:hypothetical protein
MNTGGVVPMISCEAVRPRWNGSRERSDSASACA